MCSAVALEERLMALFSRRSKRVKRAVSPTWDDFFSKDLSVDDDFDFISNVDSATKHGLSVVYGAVSLIAGKMSSLPVVIENAETGDPATRPPWVDRPDTASVVPLTFPDVIAAATTSLLLDGNAYLAVGRERRGRVTQLQVLNPYRVDIRVDGLKYAVTVDGQQPSFQILMIRNIVRPGGIEGMNPIHAARLTLQTSLGVHKVSSNFFAQGAITPGVVSIPTEVDETVLKGIAESWQKSHGGANKAHLPIVMQDAKYQSIGVSPEDAQFLETRKYTDAQIAAQLFHIDPTMLGIPVEGTSLTYANVGQRNRQLVDTALLPLMTRLELAFSSLLPSRVRFRFDTSAFLRADVQTRFETYSKAAEIGVKLGEPVISAAEIRQMEGWKGELRLRTPDRSEPQADGS